MINPGGAPKPVVNIKSQEEIIRERQIADFLFGVFEAPSMEPSPYFIENFQKNPEFIETVNETILKLIELREGLTAYHKNDAFTTFSKIRMYLLSHKLIEENYFTSQFSIKQRVLEIINSDARGFSDFNERIERWLKLGVVTREEVEDLPSVKNRRSEGK